MEVDFFNQQSIIEEGGINFPIFRKQSGYGSYFIIA